MLLCRNLRAALLLLYKWLDYLQAPKGIISFSLFSVAISSKMYLAYNTYFKKSFLLTEHIFFNYFFNICFVFHLFSVSIILFLIFLTRFFILFCLFFSFLFSILLSFKFLSHFLILSSFLWWFFFYCFSSEFFSYFTTFCFTISSMNYCISALWLSFYTGNCLIPLHSPLGERYISKNVSVIETFYW